MLKSHVKILLMPILILLFICPEFSLTQGDESAQLKKNIYKKPELVLVKGGEFIMGLNREEEIKNSDKPVYVDNPSHKVYLDSFYIDKYEVTNYQYYCFCIATARNLPELWGMNVFRCGLEYPNHPVVGVTYYDAKAYAKWRGMRLPTEAEWEYAARGGLVEKKYVNGVKLEKKNANYSPWGKGPVMVGSYPPNGFGLFDMSGNVAEWTADFFDKDYYLNSPAKNPRGPEVGKHRVIRGGGWHTGPGCMGVAYRNCLKSGWVDFNVGFRCVRDVK